LRVLRNPDTYITAVVLPVILYLLFTAVFGGAISPGGGYATYVLPGVLLTAIGFCASATGALVFQDAAGGFIERFRSMPVSRHAFLAGHAVASLARNAIAAGCVFGMALLLGGAPSPTPLGLLVALVLIALYALAITAISAVFGLIASSAEGAGAFSFTVLFLPYLSSGFVPTETMARPLRAFATYQPLSPVADALRSALAGGAVVRLPEALFWCLGLIVLFGVLAARLIVRTR
jgi:ABC-2 type transport system permease protein